MECGIVELVYDSCQTGDAIFCHYFAGIVFLPLTTAVRKMNVWWITYDTSGSECHCIGFVLSSHSSACISVALSDITQWVYSSETISNLFR